MICVKICVFYSRQVTHTQMAVKGKQFVMLNTLTTLAVLIPAIAINLWAFPDLTGAFEC